MTLTELKYIVAVAQECHFGRAAERCCITQPALSLAIQKLEDELNVTIFERHKQRVTLTTLGEQIIQQAQRVLEEAGKIGVLAAQGKNQLVGALKLGVIATVGPYLLSDLIPILRKQAPAMPLEVEENLTANLSTMLKDGKLDMLIIALPFDEPGIMVKKLYTEPFKLILPISHAWAKRARITVTQLASETVLLPHAGHCFRRHVLEQCPEISQSDSGGIQGNSLETIRQMVASGLGIAVLPSSAVRRKYQSKHLKTVAFAAPVPERQIGLAWRKGFTRPTAITVISEAIQSLKIPELEMMN